MFSKGSSHPAAAGHVCVSPLSPQVPYIPDTLNLEGLQTCEPLWRKMLLFFPSRTPSCWLVLNKHPAVSIGDIRPPQAVILLTNLWPGLAMPRSSLTLWDQFPGDTGYNGIWLGPLLPLDYLSERNWGQLWPVTLMSPVNGLSGLPHCMIDVVQ